jgi:diketogulonate reductase-like aldo/keto reductase
MAYAQRDAWGLDYIDLYLIHFPVALKYIEPETLRYPVRITFIPACTTMLSSI